MFSPSLFSTNQEHWQIANTPIIVPTNLTVWDWLFDSDSPYSVVNRYRGSRIAGYTNATTKERVNYAQVKEYTTYLSTALVKKYGLQQGDTVALFSPNTIWYPVALLGTLRAGEFVLPVAWHRIQVIIQH